MLLSNGHRLLLPALLDLVPDKVRLHFGHVCVRLEVLNAEGGEAVVDVAGQAAAGGGKIVSAHIGPVVKWGAPRSWLCWGVVACPNRKLQLLCLLGDSKASDCYKACLPAAFVSTVSLVCGFSGD